MFGNLCNLSRSSSKVILDRWHFKVIATLNNRALDLECKVVSTGRQWLIIGFLKVDGFRCHVKAPLLGLSGRGGLEKGNLICTVQKVNSYTLVISEPIEEALNSHRSALVLNDHFVVVGEAFWQHGQFCLHDNIKFRLFMDDIVRLSDLDGRKGQIDEAVLELGDIGETLRVFEDLVSDHAGDKGCCGCDGGNYLASDHLGLVPVTLTNLVVTGSQVGTSIDEVNVVIGVIIFLEFGGCE